MGASAEGMASPYFEDEDPSQIVIKPLSKYRGQVSQLG
jgi:hypothetical protein